jgi:uncharacterized coiled-coil protein SlyX
MPTEIERITELEMRVAHMERLIDELSAELLAANRARDGLGAQLERLQTRLQAAFEDSEILPASQEPPPPHY